MKRKTILLALYGFAWAPFAHAQNPAIDAAFAAAPFQQWIAQGPKAELPWHSRITPPALTLHQRIAVRVEVELDGNELVARCCEGKAVALVQITDQQGHTYRNYGEKELKDATPGLGQYMVSLSWEVFLLPGEYKATVAFYYSGRNAHNLTSGRVHVGALKHDPLQGSWRDLPTVEFCDSQPEGLDAFLLPNIEGRLRLPAKSGRPIQVEILENVTPYPSERRRPKLYTDRLAMFLPILKTFSQLQVDNGTVGLSVLDFARRSVVFDQQNITDREVSWTKFKDAMAANSVVVVDAHDLEREHDYGQFFASEMTRRLNGAGSDSFKRVVIVISGPMELGSRKPIEIAAPTESNFAVFYVRCDFLLQAPLVMRSPILGGPIAPPPQRLEALEDGVGKALRKLKPRVFGVHSAEGVREALATILSGLSGKQPQ
ncbi:MAG: hypothetical protein JWO71_2927 [Candidatus Acidoferrum typicum]|nr:hypothetical protein [Candidatus Acidoferrum typicum]